VLSRRRRTAAAAPVFTARKVNNCASTYHSQVLPLALTTPDVSFHDDHSVKTVLEI
jgi:hypothetical protein